MQKARYRIYATVSPEDHAAIMAYCRKHKIPLSRFGSRACRDLAVRLGVVQPKP